MEETKSKKAFERTKLTLAEGICSAIRFREFSFGVPLFIERGDRDRIIDLDREAAE
jgi:glutamate-1-semialdehyde aminotransferase